MIDRDLHKGEGSDQVIELAAHERLTCSSHFDDVHGSVAKFRLRCSLTRPCSCVRQTLMCRSTITRAP